MSRSHGRVLSRIWDDREFCQLPPDGQRMYLFLLSQPDLSHAGLIPLRLKRWASKSAGLTPDDVLRALKGLSSSRFVLVDEDTEEVLVRTFVRNDAVYKQPKVMIRMGEDARQIASPILRAAFVAELRRLPLGELGGEMQQRKAREVVESIVDEFADTPAEPNGEGFPEGYPEPFPSVEVTPVTVSGTESASLHVNTPAEGYMEGYAEPYPDGYAIPPAYVRVHFPIFLPPTPTTKDVPAPADPSGADAIDGLFVTPDGATDHKPRRTLDDEFADFWAVYPIKRDKQDARKAWDVQRKNTDPAVILAGAKRYRDDPNRDPGFTKYAATWLRAGGWDDEPLPARDRGGTTAKVANGNTDYWRNGGTFHSETRGVV